MYTYLFICISPSLSIYMHTYTYLCMLHMCLCYIYMVSIYGENVFANLLIASWCIHTVLRTYLLAGLPQDFRTEEDEAAALHAGLPHGGPTLFSGTT